MYGICNDGGTVIAKFTVPMAITSNAPILVTDSLSLRRYASATGAQRWEISTNVEPLSTGANELMALFLRKGYSEGIKVRVPQNYGAKRANRNLSQLKVTINTGVGSSTVPLSMVGETLNLAVGTFIKFSNHNKLYMITGYGANNYYNIFPTLRASVVENTIVNYKDDIVMDFLLDTDNRLGMQYNDGVLMDLGTVKLIEKL